MISIRLLSLLAAFGVFGGSATVLALAVFSPQQINTVVASTSTLVLITSVIVMLQHWILALSFRKAHDMQRIVAQRHGSAHTGDIDAELPPRCRDCDAGLIGYTGIYRVNDQGLVSLEETNQPCGCRVHAIRFLGAVTAPRS